MRLSNLTAAFRAAADVARAGERLLATLDRSSWSRSARMLAPLGLGVAAGFGLGALAFHGKTRRRVVEWLAPRPQARGNGVHEPRSTTA